MITITVINRNFVIRIQHPHENFTRLIGAGKYIELVGEELKNKHFLKAFNSPTHKTTFQLRRGLEINFCSK